MAIDSIELVVTKVHIFKSALFTEIFTGRLGVRPIILILFKLSRDLGIGLTNFLSELRDTIGGSLGVLLDYFILRSGVLVSGVSSPND